LTIKSIDKSDIADIITPINRTHDNFCNALRVYGLYVYVLYDNT